MKTIEQLSRECDNLAARYYSLDTGSRERAARDWLDQVKKVANMIKAGQINSKCNKKDKFKNKKGGNPATFRAISGSKNVAI